MSSPDDPVPELDTSPLSLTSPHPPPTPQPAQSVPFVDQANADDDDDMAARRGRSAVFGEVDLDLELNTGAPAQAPVEGVVTGLPSFLLDPPPPSSANGQDEETSRQPPIWQNLPPLPPNLSHLQRNLPTPPARTRMIRRAVKIEQHMPSVLHASARLQNVLEVFNAEPWPVPPLPGTRLQQLVAKRPGGRVEGSGEMLRTALTNCKMWKVDKTRWSGLGGLIDGVMRKLVAESEGHGGSYGYVLDGESMEIVPKESVQLTEEMLEYAAGATKSAGKGKEREVDDSAADRVVAVAEKQGDDFSPMNIDQSPARDATGTTVILTPQPCMSAARIVEISDDASTVCSEYLDPEDDSPLTFAEIRPVMTDADIAMAIGVIDPEVEQQPDDPLPSVSPIEDNLYGEGSSTDVFDWDGADESNTAFTTEDGVAEANLEVTMNDVETTMGDIEISMNDVDTSMHDVSSTTQDTALVPGISVTTPGESSTAIQEPTAQLTKAQKKNQARKQKGYKKPKPKKQKTEHSTDDKTAASSSAASTSAAALRKVAVENPSRKPFNLKDRRTHPESLTTPTPEKMPDTFTNSICHHATFLPHAILTLTFKSTAPSFAHPDTLRKHVIAHFEVGLDGVEAIIQGQVSISESPDWKKNVREARLGKIGSCKEGDPNVRSDKDLCAKQLAAGHGHGMWIFFAIRWRRTVHDCRSGMGGKWVCFGAPVEALKRRQGESEKVNLNHFVEGADEERLVEFRRMDIKFSTGGIPCFDLMYGAENNWNDGVWEKVKNAMATAGCVVSFLYDSEVENTQLEGGRFWGVLEKPDVEPFFTEGQMKDVPGLLPGFRTQGTRGSGLAAPGGVADLLRKGKEKAATMEEVDDEDGLSGGGSKEGEKEKVEKKAKARAAKSDGLLMPPPPTPVKRASAQGADEMAKKALEEGQKRWKAGMEMEVLCARMEKASLEQYRKGLRDGRIE